MTRLNFRKSLWALNRIHYCIGAVLLLLMLSCTDDNMQDLAEMHGGCDTIEVSYMLDIQPIMVNRCIECHSGEFPSGAIDLSNFQGVRQIAQDGRLVSVVNHEEGFLPMPYQEEKLSECSINLIEAWVDQGIQNN